jgi:TolA-binding protein
MKQVALMLTLLTSAAWARPTRHATPRKPDANQYQEEMERRGLYDKSLATPERLADEVRAADDELTTGRPEVAAARLFNIVDGPRFRDLADSDDYQDAEYRLGLALHRGGADQSARRYLARTLARGAKAPFYEAALRAYSDVCLESRALAACSAELDRIGAEDQNQEIAYLRGRAAFEAGELKSAEDELARVSPRSRFYSSAIYLRGVMRVERHDLQGASEAFCVIADTKDGDSLRFYIDGRYYALRDLARLGLGRIAHEEGRYDDAFYHYFMVPQDSSRLPEALFEAAWSSLQNKQFDLGARLVEEFLKQFPNSPKAAEGKLLYATLQVKTCRFGEAEKGFDAFLKKHEPLIALADRALADSSLREAMAARLLDANAPLSPDEAQLAALLDVDARFFRLKAIERGLRAGAIDAAHVSEAWRSLVTKLSGATVQPVGTLLAPAALLTRVEELGKELSRTRARLRSKPKGPERTELEHTLASLDSMRSELAGTLSRAVDMESVEGDKASAAQGLLPLVQADTHTAIELEDRTARLQHKLASASGELIVQALAGVRARLEDQLRRARLGKIDAVVGQKRKLEKQIEDLAAGRFPPEMFGKLHIEGLIRDDEEYWPPEPEIWLDEYEGYK